MVELENNWIALAAINARVTCEVLPHTKPVLFRGPDPHHLDVMEVFFPVPQIPKAFVFRVAGLAPGLTDAALSILESEFIEASLCRIERRSYSRRAT